MTEHEYIIASNLNKVRNAILILDDYDDNDDKSDDMFMRIIIELRLIEEKLNADLMSLIK